MRIENVHRNSAIEMRFTIVDGERKTTRFIFVDEMEDPTTVMQRMAANINLYFKRKAEGFPGDYNSAEHVAGILADARRYGTD